MKKILSVVSGAVLALATFVACNKLSPVEPAAVGMNDSAVSQPSFNLPTHRKVKLTWAMFSFDAPSGCAPDGYLYGLHGGAGIACFRVENCVPVQVSCPAGAPPTPTPTCSWVSHGQPGVCRNTCTGVIALCP